MNIFFQTSHYVVEFWTKWICIIWGPDVLSIFTKHAETSRKNPLKECNFFMDICDDVVFTIVTCPLHRFLTKEKSWFWKTEFEYKNWSIRLVVDFFDGVSLTVHILKGTIHVLRNQHLRFSEPTSLPFVVTFSTERNQKLNGLQEKCYIL